MSNGLRKIFSLLTCTLFVLVGSKLAYAQSSWQVFSPPDKSFTVELPERPRQAKPPSNTEESAESFFENTKSAYAYTLSLRKNDPVPEFSFGVLHLSKPMGNSQFDETVNSNMLWIGGDDKHFSKEADVVVSGFHGREFIYDKGIASGRALFINAGSRIYLVLFHTEVEGDISSVAVSRIFRTFKPASRVVNRTKRLTTACTRPESGSLSSTTMWFRDCVRAGDAGR